MCLWPVSKVKDNLGHPPQEGLPSGKGVIPVVAIATVQHRTPGMSHRMAIPSSLSSGVQFKMATSLPTNSLATSCMATNHRDTTNMADNMAQDTTVNMADSQAQGTTTNMADKQALDTTINVADNQDLSTTTTSLPDNLDKDTVVSPVDLQTTEGISVVIGIITVITVNIKVIWLVYAAKLKAKMEVHNSPSNRIYSLSLVLLDTGPQVTIHYNVILLVLMLLKFQ